MIQKIFIIIFLLLIQISSSYAAWYGTFQVNAPDVAKTWCPRDGDPAYAGVGIPGTIRAREYTFPAAPLANYSYDSRYQSIVSTPLRQFFCQYWDGDVPSNLVLTYPNGPSKVDVVITARARDIGGSDLQKIELWENRNGAGYTTLARTWNPVVNDTNVTWTKVYPTGSTVLNTYSYKIIAFDKAGNSTELINGNTIIFDPVDPAGQAVYTDGWFNSAQTIVISASDNVGLKRVELLQSTDSGVTFTLVPGAAWNPAGATTFSTNYVKNPVNDTAFIFQVRITDTSDNVATYTSPNVMRFDTEAPIDVIFNGGFDELATNSNAFQVKAADETDGFGAPSGELNFRFERHDSSDVLVGTSHTPVTSNPWYNFTQNIQNVDSGIIAGVNDFNTTIGGRQYSVRFTKVCDIAGNCTTVNINKTINVYANSNTIPTKSVTLNELTTLGVLANGSTRRLQIQLKDAYLNSIRRAPGISRTVDFNFNVNNTLYLNQYKRTGSAVFISTPSAPTVFNSIFPINTSSVITSTADQSIGATGIYEFGFQVYTPTKENTLADPTADFAINSITFDVNGTIGNNTGVAIASSTIPFNFQPYITAAFTGGVKTSGLLEGQDQTTQITITKSGTDMGETLPRVRLEFGSGARLPAASEFQMRYSLTGTPNTLVSDGNQASIATVTPILTSFTTDDINTRMSQVVPVATNNALYLSTHISYTLNGNNVVYNSDIIGKNNYWVDTASAGVQTGIKVTGIGTSTNTGEVIKDQFDTDVRVLGSINKADIKKDILTKVFAAIKNAPINNGTGIIQITNLTNFAAAANDGTRLSENNILYFGDLSGALVTLGDAATSGSPMPGELVTGKKTIIVYGGDLYIKSNMYYGSSASDILGIIVLAKDGVGGNVYIDKEVTNVVGNIFADKSILNYTGTVETDGSSPFDDMKNQLHILGSVYSENTIGGSRATPTQKCPYYVTNCSSRSIAQKYDLNFLRRFYIDSATTYPTGGAKVIGGGTCTTGTSCTGGNTSFNKNITATSDTSLGYSVILEYHSLLGITPPPLFGK